MFTHRGISGVKAVNEVLSRSSISLNGVLVPKDRYTDPGSIRVWRETEHNILVGVFFFFSFFLIPVCVEVRMRVAVSFGSL